MLNAPPLVLCGLLTLVRYRLCTLTMAANGPAAAEAVAVAADEANVEAEQVRAVPILTGPD